MNLAPLWNPSFFFLSFYLVNYLYHFIFFIHNSIIFICFYWIVREQYSSNLETNIIGNKEEKKEKLIDKQFIKEEKKVVSLIAKVLLAIAHCHSRGVTHRDLKPENILFENNSPDAEIKIIDFGFEVTISLFNETILGLIVIL